MLFSYNLIFPPLSLPTSLLPFLFMLLRHLFISRISTTFTGAFLVAQQMHWIFLQCRRPGFNPWVGKNLLERSMATHSSALAWRVTWTEEPGSWQSVGLHGIRYDKQLSSNSNIFAWFKIQEWKREIFFPPFLPATQLLFPDTTNISFFFK